MDIIKSVSVQVGFCQIHGWAELLAGKQSH